MLGTDKSRGYCVEMICADFLAGANLENGNSEVLLQLMVRSSSFCQAGGHPFLGVVARTRNSVYSPVAGAAGWLKSPPQCVTTLESKHRGSVFGGSDAWRSASERWERANHLLDGQYLTYPSLRMRLRKRIQPHE